MRILFMILAALGTSDLALAEKNSVCLPKYRLLSERNSEVPMQAALCSSTRTTHQFLTRGYPDLHYDFHEKLENHQSELIVHLPFRLFQFGLSTAFDKSYYASSGYSNNSKYDETLRSDSAYIGVQWTPNLNSTLAYHKARILESSYEQERFLPSLSYRPFGWLLNLDVSFLVEKNIAVAKFAAFAAIDEFHEIGLIIQPLYGDRETIQKEFIHNYRDGLILQTRLILQQSKENPDYRRLDDSDGYMLSQDLSYELVENNLVGTALSYASYKKFSKTDTFYSDDYSLPASKYPATNRGYAWSMSLNYSYVL